MCSCRDDTCQGCTCGCSHGPAKDVRAVSWDDVKAMRPPRVPATDVDTPIHAALMREWFA